MDKMEFHFSADGTKEYGKKYAHLADVTIQLPAPDERDGFHVNPKYDPVTQEGYWEYVKIEPTEMEALDKKIDNAILELTTLIAMGGMMDV